MKKLLFLFVAVLSMAIASADNFKQIDGSFEGIYPKFTVDNQQLLILETGDHSHDDWIPEYTIYDNEFNAMTTISIAEHGCQIQYAQSEREDIPVEISSNESSYTVRENITEAEADATVRDYYNIDEKYIKVIGGVKYYYLSFWHDQKEYPSRYLKFIDGNLYEYYVEYYVSVYLPVGEWRPEESGTYRDHWSYFDLSPRDFVVDIDCYATFSQTLFNNDEGFEYIVPLVEYIDYSTETTIGEMFYDYQDREWYQKYKDVVCRKSAYKGEPVMTGFKVVNQDGTTIQSVNFPSGYITRVSTENSLDVFVLNDKVYIEFDDIRAKEDYISGIGKRMTLLYQVDRNGAGIHAPKIFETGATVSPTSLKRSQNVKVTLNETLNHSCRINVIGVNGNTVYTTSIPAGSKTAEINTGSFSSGIYIVNVIDGNTVHENCKIVVR